VLITLTTGLFTALNLSLGNLFHALLVPAAAFIFMDEMAQGKKVLPGGRMAVTADVLLHGRGPEPAPRQTLMCTLETTDIDPDWAPKFWKRLLQLHGGKLPGKLHVRAQQRRPDSVVGLPTGAQLTELQAREARLQQLPGEIAAEEQELQRLQAALEQLAPQ